MRNKEEFIQEVTGQALNQNLIYIFSENGCIYYDGLSSFARFIRSEEGTYNILVDFTEEFAEKLEELFLLNTIQLCYEVEKSYGMSESLYITVEF